MEFAAASLLGVGAGALLAGASGAGWRAAADCALTLWPPTAIDMPEIYGCMGAAALDGGLNGAAWGAVFGLAVLVAVAVRRMIGPGVRGREFFFILTLAAVLLPAGVLGARFLCRVYSLPCSVTGVTVLFTGAAVLLGLAVGVGHVADGVFRGGKARPSVFLSIVAFLLAVTLSMVFLDLMVDITDYRMPGAWSRFFLHAGLGVTVAWLLARRLRLGGEPARFVVFVLISIAWAAIHHGTADPAVGAADRLRIMAWVYLTLIGGFGALGLADGDIRSAPGVGSAPRFLFEAGAFMAGAVLAAALYVLVFGVRSPTGLLVSLGMAAGLAGPCAALAASAYELSGLYAVGDPEHGGASRR